MSVLIGETNKINLDRKQLLKKVSERIKQIKDEFETIPDEFEKYIKKQGKDVARKWKKMTKKIPADDIEKLNEVRKKIRLDIINEISHDWHDRLWNIRAELVLIAAIYEFSSLKSTNSKNTNDLDLRPLVLRMGGPTKKNISSNKPYNPIEAYNKMVTPLFDAIKIIHEKIMKLKKINGRSSLRSIKLANKEIIIAREYLTRVVQATAPRKDN